MICGDDGRRVKKVDASHHASFRSLELGLQSFRMNPGSTVSYQVHVTERHSAIYSTELEVFHIISF